MRFTAALSDGKRLFGAIPNVIGVVAHEPLIGPLASDLHGLLKAAHLPAPYVLAQTLVL